MWHGACLGNGDERQEFEMQDATTAQVAAEPVSKPTPLPLRGDTFLGVCEAMGQDTRIPADLFRIAFAALFFWSMGLALAVYLGLGAVIAVSRWLFPTTRTVASAPAQEAIEQEDEEPLSLAA
jgi:phage shock protein PspC (stress-responsive transcriptional regulator)